VRERRREREEERDEERDREEYRRIEAQGTPAGRIQQKQPDPVAHEGGEPDRRRREN